MDAGAAAAQKAAALTHRLLAFVRKQSLDIPPNNVNALIESMEEMLRRTSVDLKWILAPDLWLAFTDANQVESAVLNLAMNARDAIEGNGQLVIRTSNLVEDKTSGDLLAGEYVVVEVADTGTGMAADVLERAVDPFFTTKPVGTGTGLGLSMVYGFAKQGHGHLHIESEVGKGTSVKLLLPRAFQEAIILDSPNVPHGKGETILVVEDDDRVRLILADVLKELGYNVLVAPMPVLLFRSSNPVDRST